ncbi:MAG TPA: hypothetical protein VHE81_00490 [Lacipirellulaceae bacterium]|nr:hypothetical protein [Lacipirellulaceae bacterium]
MARHFLAAIVTFALMECVAFPLAYGIERGRGTEGQPADNRVSGGAWSERYHHGGTSHRNYDQAGTVPGATKHTDGQSDSNRQSSDYTNTTHAASSSSRLNRGATTESNSHDAAAGAALANRRSPQYSGTQGAAAGAAVANRRQPTYSGAQGAAAGAAIANRRAPQFSGAEGAAAGAAVANRSQPTVSGAQGAAIGAAAANQNAPSLSGAQGAALGAAAANQNAAPPSGAAATMGAAAVRNSFNNYNLFGQQWYGSNPEAWAPSGWISGNAWTPGSWRTVAGYYGSRSAPIWYDYGNNVTYQNGNIMMNGQNLGTADEYSQQAVNLAQTGAASEPPATADWLPLGVFAMVRDEQQRPQLIMQLSINKHGVLRGNFTDETTEFTQTIRGAVDPKSQRVAWFVGNHRNAVMEAGLSNLAEGDAPALLHKNGRTDHWLLVRLEQPANGAPTAQNR